MRNITKKYTASPHAQYFLHDKHYLSPVFAPSLNLIGGNGDYVFDQQGKKYIDFTSGIAVNTFGHRNSKIIAAVESQIFTLMHVSNLYTTPVQLELAHRLVTLANKAFEDIQYSSVFFSNSGTEANEAALKFAKAYATRAQNNIANKTEILSFSEGFHGRTMGSLSVTSENKYKLPFAPLLPDVTILPFNDAEALSKKASSTTAAIIVEPVQGEGGLSSITKSFATAINNAAEAYHIIVIADEVQTGLYRTGSLFASTRYGLSPHIITLAKSLGGGLPLGATVTSKAVHDILVLGDHGSTTGGNPVAASAAIAVLNTLHSPAFTLQRLRTESSLNTAIIQLTKRHPDTSALGKGSLRGIRLPSIIHVQEVIVQARTRGLLILRTGMNSLRIAPSLVCAPSTIKKGMHILHKILTEAKDNTRNKYKYK